MTRGAMDVVKVGGSLLDWQKLPARLTTLLAERYPASSSVRPLLVCGGGPFADGVRDLDRVHGLSAVASHQLAILAMDLAAAFLATIVRGGRLVRSPALLGEGGRHDETLVCLPSAVIEDLERSGRETLPPSWDVTSDSISAWIAHGIQARSLLLLKSTDAPPGCTREAAAHRELVDRLFPRFSAGLERVEYLNLRDSAGEPVLLAE